MPIPVHVLDFEGNLQLGVAEWGVVSLDGQSLIATRTQRCRPQGTPEGISENWADFNQNAAYFLKLRRSGLFCSHSRSFEDNLLRRYWASPGYVPSFTSASSVTTWGPWLDTCAIWMHLIPRLASYNLMDLVQSCSLQESLRRAAAEHCPPDKARPHGALYDALAASLLLRLALRLVPQRTLADWIFYSNPQQL